MPKYHPEFAAIAFEKLNGLTAYIEKGLGNFHKKMGLEN